MARRWRSPRGTPLGRTGQPDDIHNTARPCVVPLNLRYQKIGDFTVATNHEVRVGAPNAGPALTTRLSNSMIAQCAISHCLSRRRAQVGLGSCVTSNAGPHGAA
jgi:hypothetical protein